MLWQHRIHMVHEETAMNLMPRNTQITPIVPDDHQLSSLLPFARSIKMLIDPAIESERSLANLTNQGEICKSLLKGGQVAKLGIRSSLHRQLRSHRKTRKRPHKNAWPRWR